MSNEIDEPASSSGRENQHAEIRQLLDLGRAHHTAGHLAEARESYLRVVESDPDHPDALHLLGVIAQQLGKNDEAVILISRALSSKPDFAEALNSLGAAFNNLGKLDEAVAALARATAIKSDYAEAFSNLAATLQKMEKSDEAITCYQKAIAIKGDFATAQSNLGNLYKDSGHLEQAHACFMAAIASNPQYAEAHNNLATLYKDLGRFDQCVKSFHKALSIDPNYSDAHSNLLLSEQYRAGHNADTLRLLHEEWDARHAQHLAEESQNHPNARDPDKTLRIGFVSADLRRHPIGYFLIGLLSNINGRGMEVTCYSDGKSDDLSERLQSASRHWVNCQGMADAGLDQLIRGDQIDILFDLAGHTAHNRLTLFARKVAPVQVSWAGYVGTTGLRAMDYLLSDAHYTPPRAHYSYTEKIINMPHAYVCYEAPSYAPAVGPLPWRENGYVTFGCFNNSCKINDHVMALWLQILQAVPNSRLLLKYKGLDHHLNSQRILSFFTDRGIQPERLRLEGGCKHRKFLDSYNHIDIALDTFPYSGGLTTCEALWMGVPVISVPGDTFASRHSCSYLNVVGLSELLAGDHQQYVKLAVDLAGNPGRLGTLRATLRARMAASAICDGPQFAADFTSRMRHIWKDWCDSAPPGGPVGPSSN